MAYRTGLVGAALLCFLAACSANSGDGGDNGFTSSGGNGATSSGGSGNSSSGANGGTFSTGGTFANGGSFANGGTFSQGGSSQGGTGGDCGGTLVEGERKQVDLFLMMDLSGSMNAETVANGPTKWEAVRDALKGFISAPESAGLGMGVQYFPLLNQGNSWTCQGQNSQCGSGGTCLNQGCFGGLGFSLCLQQLDCTFGPGGDCLTFGVCAAAPDEYVCPASGPNSILGQDCADGLGNNYGQCIIPDDYQCTDVDSCIVGDYQSPDVGIAALPGNAGALTASLDAQEPRGLTPTGPALQGAIQAAQAHAAANPNNTVITVLATDGIPTSCNPTDIGQIANLASTAANGSPAISTYVIGVFASDEQEGQQNANQIAQAGGTNTAFIVDPNSNSAQQDFIAALEEIRGATLSCNLAIPEATGPNGADYDDVNVVFSSGGTDTNVFYVGSAANCDPQDGGWYYDVADPDVETPTEIIVCPATCDAFEAGGNVDIQLGCPTIIAPPK